MLPKVIYQIHRTSGEFEDFLDELVATYYSKERAREHFSRLVREQSELDALSEKCNHCPINKFIDMNTDKVRRQILDYCDDAKLVTFSEDETDENTYLYCQHCAPVNDNVRFAICEVVMEDAE